ncbi:acyl-CoA/acyl-ACP dehydrogenase [Streptomyces sp. NBC_01136]|uniref:acyl-CoA dehydrogenase n=1 Tax=Streptomyces sp. NBC_01136 TaxID=2903754 RepID=UPI00386629C6|nr:acyl-CoA/acyl-ACP dehydrogenase [Streptomyces sp. NBC_01136]WST81112.1 acyl-CoA/acyl-ACP dehydrogenase [Streptomyces sp. NBC_01136]
MVSSAPPSALLTQPPPGLPAGGAPARVARLEGMLGDPAFGANPVGYRALLHADRRAVLLAEAEGLLDDFGMNREFVPKELGGRFDSAETLLRVMRPVFRRDVALGAGYGMTTFMAASDVWMQGSAGQRSWLAGLLLAGSKAAIAQHETAHTNDFVRSQVRAQVRADGLAVTGGKPVINNLHRADALVLFCRTEPQPGTTGCHSVLLLDPHTLPAGRYRVTRRPAALGLRGCYFAGVDLDSCLVPRDTLLGPLGSGVPTALRSFQVSRTLMASLVSAAVDTGLRTAVLVDRTQGPGRSGLDPADPQHTAGTLASAFVNLLLYDCLAVVATRALHLLPAETSIYSAAVKLLLPRVLSETMYGLATVLGSQIYTREGTVGIFQKHIRDVPVVSLGHAGTVACQATIIPQLRALAEESWFSGAEAPAALFRPGAELPPFDYNPLSLACGRDSVSATLLATAASLPGAGPIERTLRELAGQMTVELHELRSRVLALPPLDAARPVGPSWFALTDRYVLVLAAACVLGVWRHNQGGPDPFLADPAWAAAALHRIAQRLGIPAADLPAEATARVHQEVLARYGDRRSFDLYNTPLPG